GAPGVICEGGRASPQRSPTHTLVPSGSMPTALVDPQVRPSGSWPQFSMERYGLGRALVGGVWANDGLESVTIAMAEIAIRKAVMGASNVFSPHPEEPAKRASRRARALARSMPPSFETRTSLSLGVLLRMRIVSVRPGIRLAHERRELGVEPRRI